MAYSKMMPIEQRRQREAQNVKRYNETHRALHAREQREWRAKLRENPEKWEEFKSRKNRQRSGDRKRQHREAIEHYGAQCYCCGERTFIFLALDHIGGGGTRHRRELGHIRVENWAKRNGWPPIFRVACHNCNFGTHLNGGFCPHLCDAMSDIVELASILFGCAQ